LKKYFATKRKLFKEHMLMPCFACQENCSELHQHMFCKFSTEIPETLALGIPKKTVMFPDCLHSQALELRTGLNCTNQSFRLQADFAEHAGMRRVGWLDFFKGRLW